MSEGCPYLRYRAADGDREFDAARAYCAAAERFVQPLRADVCNDRYDLYHATDCEIYLAHAEGEDDGGRDGGGQAVTRSADVRGDGDDSNGLDGDGRDGNGQDGDGEDGDP